VAKTFEHIDDLLASWLCDQPVFFVATAPLSGDGAAQLLAQGQPARVPRHGTTHRCFLDQTGSGVETIAHLKENGRIVVMFCAFAGPPRIVRLHGTGRTVLKDSPEFDSLVEQFAGASGRAFDR